MRAVPSFRVTEGPLSRAIWIAFKEDVVCAPIDGGRKSTGQKASTHTSSTPNFLACSIKALRLLQSELHDIGAAFIKRRFTIGQIKLP